MKTILVFTILILTFNSTFGQTSLEQEYPYPFNLVFNEGKKDTSKLDIKQFNLAPNDSFNLIGTVLQKYVDSNDIAELGSSNARIRLINKKDTSLFYVDETFSLKIPNGKYQIRITKVGVGKIDRKLNFAPNKGYIFAITLLTRRVIKNEKYRCKTKKDRRVLKRILNSSEENFKEKCNCIWTGTTIYG